MTGQEGKSAKQLIEEDSDLFNELRAFSAGVAQGVVRGSSKAQGRLSPLV